MNIEKIKNKFPILKQKNRGKPLVYFDNAATSLKPLSVIDSESDFYKKIVGARKENSTGPLIIIDGI